MTPQTVPRRSRTTRTMKLASVPRVTGRVPSHPSYAVDGPVWRCWDGSPQADAARGFDARLAAGAPVNLPTKKDALFDVLLQSLAPASREQLATLGSRDAMLHAALRAVASYGYAEDALAAAVGQGVRQYVILGAGLDSFGLYLAPMIRAALLHVPFGTGRHAPIAAEDQARVIVGILENPAPHRGKVYPLFGPVESTYQEIAQTLSRVLGKEVQYKQVSFETMLQLMGAGAQKPPAEHTAQTLVRRV
jgi:uncharacterized protein YbjT (DUF2867 family)